MQGSVTCLCCASKQGAIGQISVPRHPPAVSGAPEHIARLRSHTPSQCSASSSKRSLGCSKQGSCMCWRSAVAGPQQHLQVEDIAGADGRLHHVPACVTCRSLQWVCLHDTPDRGHASCWIVSPLASPVLCMTPFGLPVDPEVYLQSQPSTESTTFWPSLAANT